MIRSTQLKSIGSPVRQGVSVFVKLGIVAALSGAGVAVTFDAVGASTAPPSPITYTDASTTVTAIVPAGVCALTFNAVGGQGGGTEGGNGGQVQATVTMSAGESYAVAVGGAGGPAAGG